MAELSKLGRYQLKRVLGRGAMGVVYEGLDPSLNRRVAVKTILKNAAIDADTARQYSALFAREAQAAGRLNHPNIVQVHDFAEEGDVAYLVMEYIEGRELRGFFEAKEKFETGEAVRIMGELLDALHFAHEAGVVHRDVKPANVMLDAQRRVKLADFGVARIQDSERSAAGTMVGTPAFMSPEQIQGMKIDRRTDIFSAGTILYQLLTGEQPFKGEGAWTVAKKIVEENPPQPSTVVKSVSPVFDGIVSKALAKNPAQRFASAREFAAALRATIAPAQASAPPTIFAPKVKAAPQTSDAELEFWRAIQNSADAAEFEFYLEQFPEGTYAGLARHKIAKLNAPAEAERRAAEEKARQEAEAQAKREAEEKARREAADRARREAEEKAKQEAIEKTRREAAEKARGEAVAKAKREAEEKARRETEEKLRQAQALARLKQQEEAAARARAKANAAMDEDATVAQPTSRQEATRTPTKAKSIAIPAAIAAVAIVSAVGAYIFAGRSPAPVVDTAPANPTAVPVPVVDAEKIRRETEERLRKEFAEKAAAERAAMEKAVMEKIAAERAAAERVTQAKTAAERAAAEKAAASASAERVAAQKAAAEKAATNKAAAEKADALRAAAEKAAMEKAAAEKALAEKAAAEKTAAESAAAEKAAAQKAEVEKAEGDKYLAEVRAGLARDEARLERFMQRQGRGKFFKSERDIGPLPFQQSAYVLDRSCPSGQIKEVWGGNNFRNTPRTRSCIPIPD